MKNILKLSVLVLVLSACGQQPIAPALSDEQSLQTAVAQVEQTMTAAVPVSIPLSEIDLQPYLFAEGDLPAQLTPGQVRDIAPGMFDSITNADNTAFLQFSNGTDNAGGATVFLFEDKSRVDATYTVISSGLGDAAEPITNVGEKASGVSLSPLLDAVDITFQRCAAVVHIRMVGITDMDAVVSYGRRLDERLTPVVCK